MGLLDKLLPATENRQDPPIRMYNHVEIFNEYKDYCKGKKSFEKQPFELWILETYPNMLYIKRD